MADKKENTLVTEETYDSYFHAIDEVKTHSYKNLTNYGSREVKDIILAITTHLGEISGCVQAYDKELKLDMLDERTCHWMREESKYVASVALELMVVADSLNVTKNGGE